MSRWLERGSVDFKGMEMVMLLSRICNGVKDFRKWSLGDRFRHLFRMENDTPDVSRHIHCIQQYCEVL